MLHGVELWVALPDAARDCRHRSPTTRPTSSRVTAGGAGFLGSLLGTLAGRTASPLVGAELVLDPGATLDLDVDPAHEHGVLVDTGVVSVQGTEVKEHALGYVAPGTGSLRLEAHGPGRACWCSAASHSVSRS